MPSKMDNYPITCLTCIQDETRSKYKSILLFKPCTSNWLAIPICINRSLIIISVFQAPTCWNVSFVVLLLRHVVVCLAMPALTYASWVSACRRTVEHPLISSIRSLRNAPLTHASLAPALLWNHLKSPSTMPLLFLYLAPQKMLKRKKDCWTPSPLSHFLSLVLQLKFPLPQLLHLQLALCLPLHL